MSNGNAQCPTNLRVPCIPTNSGEAGLTAQELANILSPFLNGAKNTLFASKSGNQAVAATPFTITWDQTTGAIPISSNQFTLTGGITYELLMDLRCLFSGAGNASFAFFDVTNAETINGIVTSGHGKVGLVRPVTDTGNLSNAPLGGAILTPSTDIVVEARITAETNLTQIDSLATWMSVKEL